MYAAKEGRVKVCEKLLEQGAEINKQDMRGWTVSVVITSPEDETSVCSCFNFLETLGSLIFKLCITQMCCPVVFWISLYINIKIVF